MLIFKGAKNGLIATKEFPTYPINRQYLCQPKAWMGEEAMYTWIYCVLILRKNTKAPGVVPIHILALNHVHMMGNIVNCIQSLGIEVIHIPAGCTYLCQPVDVGINKTIKTGMSKKWEDWMTDGEGIVDGVAKEPSHKVVAEWLAETYTTMPETIGRNAWMKTGFEWF